MSRRRRIRARTNFAKIRTIHVGDDYYTRWNRSPRTTPGRAASAAHGTDRRQTCFALIASAGMSPTEGPNVPRIEDATPRTRRAGRIRVPIHIEPSSCHCPFVCPPTRTSPIGRLTRAARTRRSNEW